MSKSRDAQAQSRLDNEWNAALLRVLTLNMHGRPMDTVPVVGGDLNGVSYSRKVCDPVYHLQNGQERRMRGLFEWLDRLPVHQWPDVFCFQEITWVRWFDSCHQQLVQRGYVTHDALDWRRDIPGSNVKRDEKTRVTPPVLAGSGLGIYVLARRGLSIVHGMHQPFSDQLGYDQLTSKGAAFALIKIQSPMISGVAATSNTPIFCGVVNTHTLAYINYVGDPRSSSEHDKPIKVGDTCRNPTSTEFRAIAAKQLADRGGYPEAIVRAHRQQLAAIQQFIYSGVLPFLKQNNIRLHGLYIVGDMNINRYKTTSATSSLSPSTANVCCSDEYFEMLSILDAKQPPITLSPPPPLLSTASVGPWKCSGMFSWDSGCNTVISEDAVPPPTYEWLDYVLYAYGKDDEMRRSLFADGRPDPLYMDNRVVRIQTTRYFPEISAFWQPGCTQKRISYLKSLTASAGGQIPSATSDPYLAYLVANLRQANAHYDARYQQGVAQQQVLLLAFCKRNAANVSPQSMWKTIVDDAPRGGLTYRQWCEYIYSVPESESMNVWKGLDYYGWNANDVNITADWADPTGRPRWVGEPHGYRMLNDVSDHFGVMANVLLDTAPNRKAWDEYNDREKARQPSSTATTVYDHPWVRASQSDVRHGSGPKRSGGIRNRHDEPHHHHYRGQRDERRGHKRSSRHSRRRNKHK